MPDAELIGQPAASEGTSRPPRGWWWRAVQGVLLIVTLVLAGRVLNEQWAEVVAIGHAAPLRWRWIMLSVIIVLSVHAMLIHTWRLLLAGWGSHLPFGSAIRIWTVSNLGKYLPGKVWSIGAMGVLAQREGISGVSAAGAALLNAMLNLGAGLGVIAIAGTAALEALGATFRVAALIGSLVFVAGVAILPRVLPLALQRLARWRGLPPIAQQLSSSTLWLVTFLHALSWIGYGLAFAVFARGVLPDIAGDPFMSITVYATSYLAGYLAVFAPGGIGVRESSMIWLLMSIGHASIAEATFLSLASRAWLTLVELLPGLIALWFTSNWRRSSGRRVG